MAQRTIQTFNGTHIAIYRPNKRTYSIIKFNHDHRVWLPHYEHVPEGTVSLNRLALESVPNVKIGIKHNRIIDCNAYGEYILWIKEGITHNVPIIRKLGNSAINFPNTYYSFEFKCTVNSILPPVDALWELAPLPIQQVPAPVPVIQRVRTPKEIPQRIAWIIAEDASKKEDTCPITLELISPLTAAVTSCYHVFDANAIASWFETHTECPVCKTKCVTTVCFTEK